MNVLRMKNKKHRCSLGLNNGKIISFLPEWNPCRFPKYKKGKKFRKFFYILIRKGNSMSLMTKMYKIFAYLTGFLAVIIFIGVAFTKPSGIGFGIALAFGALAFWFNNNSKEVPDSTPVENK